MNNRTQEWWDAWFIDLARYVSTASKDPSTKVGAVVVDDYKRIISIGYNGFPRGVSDSEDRYNDKELKLSIVLHAEENAILFANRSLIGTTIYLWPMLSCPLCTSKIIQVGISNVVHATLQERPYHTLARELYQEAGVKVTGY